MSTIIDPAHPPAATTSAAAFDPTTTMQFFDDFNTCWYAGSGQIISEYTWKTIQSGSPSFASGTSTKFNSGFLRITCTANGDIGSICLGQFNTTTTAPFVTGNGQLTFEALVNLGAISNGTDNNQINIGLADSPAGSAASNQMIFYYEIGGSANWQFLSTASSTTTTLVSSIAVTAGWHHLKFVVNAAGTSVAATVDGVSLGSAITTNIPTAALPPMLSLRRTAGTLARTLDIDYVKIDKTFTTPR